VGSTSTFREAVRRLSKAGVPTASRKRSGRVPHPDQGDYLSDSPGLALHESVTKWFEGAETYLNEQPETVVNSPYAPQLFRSMERRYTTGVPGCSLNRPRDRPRGFREVSTFPDEESVKRSFRGALSLSAKQKDATEKCTRTALAAASYARHFMDGAASSLDELHQMLTETAQEVESLGPAGVRDRLLEMRSVSDLSRDSLAHGQLAVSDCTGAVVGADVNLTLALRDKFIPKLRSYLSPHHRMTLRNSSLLSEALFPSLPEVREAARQDAAQESTRRLASLPLSGSQRPSSNVPPKSGGKRKSSSGEKGSGPNSDRQSSGSAGGFRPPGQFRRQSGKGRGSGRGDGGKRHQSKSS